MTTTPPAVFKMRIDTSGFTRGIHDINNVMRNMSADLRGAPRPPRKPYPKTCSHMTARQYRAARRRYARERRAYSKALRDWTPDTPRAMRAFADLAAAMQKARRQEQA